MAADSLLPAREIRPAYQGMPILNFLYDTQDEPDDALVIFEWLPWIRLPDGTMRPASVTLGDVRKEFYIRSAFPHQAQTAVW